MTVTSDDGFSAARTACIDEIDKLRATQGLAAYTLVNTDTNNMCVDAQATSDEASGQAHMAWMAAACPNCDFYGSSGSECGHYVNMSATYFAEVACGFSTKGGWAAQNFDQ